MTQEPVQLSLFELLDRSFQEIRRRFVPFFLLACLGPVLSWLLMSLCFGFSPFTQSANRSNHPILLMVVTFISALLGLFTLSALVLYICKRAKSVREALSLGLRRVPHLLLAGILLGLAFLLIAVILMIPSLIALLLDCSPTVLFLIVAINLLFLMLAIFILAIYLCFWQYRLILTDEPLFVSLRNAYLLVKGNFWPTLGFMLVLMLINMGFMLCFYMTFGLLGLLITLITPVMAWLASLFFVLAGGITALIMQVPLIALYLNRLSLEPASSSEQPETTEGV